MGYADDGIVAINYKNKGIRILKKVVSNNCNIYDVKKTMQRTHKMRRHILILLKS